MDTGLILLEAGEEERGVVVVDRKTGSWRTFLYGAREGREGEKMVKV